MKSKSLLDEYSDFIQNYPLNRMTIPSYGSMWTWIDCNPENEYKKSLSKRIEINEEIMDSCVGNEDTLSHFNYCSRNCNSVKQLSPENLFRKRKNELMEKSYSGMSKEQIDRGFFPRTDLRLNSGCEPIVSAKNENDSLLILHGISGTAGEYFRLMKALLEKGFRVISVQYPIFTDIKEWCRSFSYFLEQLELKNGVHLYGSDIGGLLGIIFSQVFPNMVKSLILCNSFLLTLTVPLPYMASTFLYLCPKFVLIKLISEIFKKNNYCYMPPEDIGYESANNPDDRNHNILMKYDKLYNESFNFSINQLYSVSHSDLADRLNFLLSSREENSVFFNKSNVSSIGDINITFISTVDCSFVEQELYENISKLPHFKPAQLKYGGDFPHISNHEDVALFCQVHLRNSNAKKCSFTDPSSQPALTSFLTSKYPHNGHFCKKSEMDKYYDMPYPGNIIHHESSFGNDKLRTAD